MKDARSIFQELVSSITLQEHTDEVRSIALMILEHFLGLSSTEIMAGKPVSITEGLSASLAQAVTRVNDGEPVQYVIGEAFFYGRSFVVNPSVLIPRPETEELVRSVLSSKIERGMEGQQRITILDIGTGSGCIPVTLALEIKGAQLVAADVSAAALAVAKINAERHNTEIRFIKHDILQGLIPIEDLNVIVSNPPYVTMAEARQMQPNVLDFEPHLALFVPDDDPLLFYRAIVRQAAKSLIPGGLLAVEINERYGQEISDLLINSGFRDVHIQKDIPGKPRVAVGRKIGVVKQAIGKD